MREVIKGYGDANDGQKVTVEAKPTDIRQRKKIDRWWPPRPRGIGEVWYDLNIDGYVSDLTATFWIVQTPGGLTLMLNDIHVMQGNRGSVRDQLGVRNPVRPERRCAEVIDEPRLGELLSGRPTSGERVVGRRLFEESVLRAHLRDDVAGC